MKTFEYITVNHTLWIHQEQDRMNGHWFEDRLDKYGAEGWEMVAKDEVFVYLKRLVQPQKDKTYAEK